MNSTQLASLPLEKYAARKYVHQHGAFDVFSLILGKTTKAMHSRSLHLGRRNRRRAVHHDDIKDF